MADDEQEAGEDAPLLGAPSREARWCGGSIAAAHSGERRLGLAAVILTAAMALAWHVARQPALPSAYDDCARATPACPVGGGARPRSNVGSIGTSGRLWSPVHIRNFTRPRRFARSVRQQQQRERAWARLPQDGHCEQWVVITTIFPPTRLVQQLAELPGWCTVVVGDRRAPTAEAYMAAIERPASGGGRVVYLSAAEQERLGYRVLGLLKWNHFGRKNVGFVYAIAHGARLVYDTDDDNELLDPGALSAWARALRSPSTRVHAWRACAPVLNPYPHFGSARERDGWAQFAWPRGFPLESIRDCGTMLERPSDAPADTAPMSAIGVVQSLANHDPDVDAIYRLRHHLPVGFERRHPAGHPAGAVALGNATVAPFNAQATLWSHSALWGLLLPISVHGRVSDIWRSYFAQRVLRELGLQVAFAEPWVKQERNAHTYLADFDSETPLYLRAGALVAWLDAWLPSARAPGSGAGSVASVIEELAIALYQVGVIEEGDVLLQQAWLDDLLAAGYELPTAAVS